MLDDPCRLPAPQIIEGHRGAVQVGHGGTQHRACDHRCQAHLQALEVLHPQRAITAAGRQAFRQWLAMEPGPETIRFPLLLTVLFGRHLPPGRLGVFIEEHRRIHARRHEEYRIHLEHLLSAPSEHVDPYVLATSKFGLAYEKTILDWFADLPPEIGAGDTTGGQPADDRQDGP